MKINNFKFIYLFFSTSNSDECILYTRGMENGFNITLSVSG